MNSEITYGSIYQTLALSCILRLLASEVAMMPFWLNLFLITIW